MIQFIFFDFGGTLDSDGIHGRTIFKNAFTKEKLISSNNKAELDSFQDAYSYADERMVHEGLCLGLTLLQMNELHCRLIGEKLGFSLKATDPCARDITQKQSEFIKKNIPTIHSLAQHYKLGIISNFTGNLEVILKEKQFQNLRDDFSLVFDSYHVGHVKPSKTLYQIAFSEAKIPFENILYIGDNIERDILPAKSFGVKTGLIYDKNRKDLESYLAKSFSDFTLSELSLLPSLIQRM